MSQLYEMGWNDVLGNVRKSITLTPEQIATPAGLVVVRPFLNLVVDNKINLPNYTEQYRKGAIDAATAILEQKPVAFKGPKWVVDDLEEKCQPET